MITILAFLASYLIGSPIEHQPSIRITTGQNLIVVRMDNKRLVVSRAGMSRYLAGYAPPFTPSDLEVILHHCERPTAILMHIEAEINRGYGARYIASSGVLR